MIVVVPVDTVEVEGLGFIVQHVKCTLFANLVSYFFKRRRLVGVRYGGLQASIVLLAVIQEVVQVIITNVLVRTDDEDVVEDDDDSTSGSKREPAKRGGERRYLPPVDVVGLASVFTQ